jgi:prophage regulatory protein
MLQPTNVRLLRLPEVLKIMRMSRSAWYQGMADGRFPRPIKLGGIALWRASEIYKLIDGATIQRNADYPLSHEQFSS